MWSRMTRCCLQHDNDKDGTDTRLWSPGRHTICRPHFGMPFRIKKTASIGNYRESLISKLTQDLLFLDAMKTDIVVQSGVKGKRRNHITQRPSPNSDYNAEQMPRHTHIAPDKTIGNLHLSCCSFRHATRILRTTWYHTSRNYVTINTWYSAVPL